jgi:hypothetical protein
LRNAAAVGFFATFQDFYAVALTSKIDPEKAVPPFRVVEFQHTDDVF